MEIIGLTMPKEVRQPPNSYKCWAAALEAWLGVTPQAGGFQGLSMEEAVKLFTHKSNQGPEDPYSANALGGLNMHGKDADNEFNFMAVMVGMDFLVFPKDKMKLLTGSFLYPKLKDKGHIYIVVSGGQVTNDPTLAHAGVIWAMKDWSSADCIVAVMDPIHGYVPDRPLSYYRSAANAIVGWPQ